MIINAGPAFSLFSLSVSLSFFLRFSLPRPGFSPALLLRRFADARDYRRFFTDDKDGRWLVIENL